MSVENFTNEEKITFFNGSIKSLEFQIRELIRLLNRTEKYLTNRIKQRNKIIFENTEQENIVIQRRESFNKYTDEKGGVSDE